MQRILEIAKHFNTESEPASVRRFGRGNVNDTYLVGLKNGGSIILQKLNSSVFKNPTEVMINAVSVTNYLAKKAEANEPVFKFFLTPNGKFLVLDNGEYWRACSFVSFTHSPDNNASLSEIEDFGRLLGDFHANVAAFPVDKLYFTIPDFHNTPKRYDAFVAAAKAAPTELLASVKGELGFIESRKTSCSLILDMNLPARVTHNDVKMDNVLISDETDRAVSLIDFDTVMPGVYAFDFGDAVRSTCFGCDENERDMTKVKLDEERFAAFTRGYISKAKSVLTSDELKSLVMGVRMISYELGMRFLSDYLSGNTYFKINSPDHNLIRARIQLLICAQVEKNYNKMCSPLVGIYKK